MNPVMKTMAKIHTAVIRLSGGRMGNTMGGAPILLLHHVGAKSGKKYASPLGYVEDDGVYAVVAAAAGAPTNPGWFYNLKKNPNTTIEIEGRSINVTAEVAPKAKRDQIWADVSAKHDYFPEYQAKTSREIPIMLLRPAS